MDTPPETTAEMMRKLEAAASKMRNEQLWKVRNAQQATEIAMEFLRKYHTYSSPKRAVKQDSAWLVQADVGLFETRIAKILIDARTGEILDYVIP